ncbi:ADP-ribosylation factor-binding protein GGA3 [Kryptolebias marmoratus]|uniref:Golgi associated, gamma adaptin ear containing, ARF binding protein 3b n=1 Tax=Kryptolebias marmoratus TaxID=37003 RepID=A0A3Q3GYA1_KRYMA|nr:ADP-ribosylation factor-binding protein GGA3 [Kryptolebias marmoratus]
MFSASTAVMVFSTMAYHDDDDSLETWLEKATHRTNREEDWEYIISFCDRVNKEQEGPEKAKSLLLTKIACSQEWEALQALTVLEACMKNCGRRFQKEVTRNHFLTYLFQLVWTEYLGDKTPLKVKKRIVELVCSWTAAFPNEKEFIKTFKAFKSIGLVTPDVVLTVDRTLILSSPTHSKHPVFDNKDINKLLAELLRSKNPEDLREANRLIKSMVKEDEARAQKVTKQVQTLEEVNNNVRLLTEMLSHYDKDSSSDSDKEIIKELCERCDKLRSAAFKMASETEDGDSSLGDILQATDDLSRVINSYKKIVGGEQVDGSGEEPQSTGAQSESAVTTDTLVDIEGLDAPTPPEPAPSASQSSPPVCAGDTTSPIPVLPPPPSAAAGSHPRRRRRTCQPSLDAASPSLSLLDDELLSLRLNDNPTSKESSEQTKPMLGEISSPWTSLQAPGSSVDVFGGVAGAPLETAASHSLKSLQDLAMMGFSDLKASQLSQAGATGSSFGIPAAAAAAAPPLVPEQGAPSSTVLHSTTPGSPALSQSRAEGLAMGPGSPLFRSLSPGPLHLHGSPSRGSDVSLSNVHVAPEAIKPSKILPVTAYDKDGVRVLVTFASDCPPGRPDVLVMVVTTVNTAPLPVHNVVLHAAVPKSMKVKLQPPSGTELAAFNPPLSPASITQILLLANPAKEKVRLRYKLTFSLGDCLCDEAGEVDQFPLPETWGHL